MSKSLQSSFNVSRSVIVWALAVAGLTGLAVLWLWMTHVDPRVDFSPAIILIAYSPAFAATLVAWLLPGAGGLGALYKQILLWRVNIGWYTLALLGPIVLVLFATLLGVLFFGITPTAWLAIPGSGAIGGLIGPLIAGSIGEELGWRGFAQRLLQKRFNLLYASLIVGLFWATWHSWPVLAPGASTHVAALDILETYVRLVSTAVIYGWIFARTQGSVLLVMLAHAGHNIAVDLLPVTLLNTTAMPLLIACLYFAAAVVLVAVRPVHFFRQPGTQE